jgi:hypothetical protein
MKKKIVIFFILMCICFTAWSHIIPYELDKPDNGHVFWKYLSLGYTHIIPKGFDHILFILCIFFLNTSIRQIVLQASMFTLAHSITLGLAAYGIISPPASIVEPLIALSIVFLAIENMYSTKVRSWRLLMVFLFGMIHGMGFAGALSELGLPQNAFAESLLSFNLGVELGQLTIIVLMYLFVAKIFSTRIWYRRYIVLPSSLVIASIAMCWTIQRVFL